MTSPATPTAREIVLHFGGPTNLVRLATHHGVTPLPNLEQVKKWAQRNSMPGGYVLPLVRLGELIGKPVVLPDTTHHGASA